VRGELGVAASTAVVVVAVLLVLSAAAVGGAAVLVGQRRASAAADLGALAGAVALQHGQAGCDAVRRLVRRHDDARLRACVVVGDVVRVTVVVDVGVIAGRTVSVAARARAGPRRTSGSL
jgi:secretion/DNA translocation related TadE-like protein